MSRRDLCISIFVVALLLLYQPFAIAGGNIVSVENGNILLNGKPISVIGLRCSNALISDEPANDLIAHLDTFRYYGVNTVSVFFMGSRFGDVKGYNDDGNLDPIYKARMGRMNLNRHTFQYF